VLFHTPVILAYQPVSKASGRRKRRAQRRCAKRHRRMIRTAEQAEMLTSEGLKGPSVLKGAQRRAD
jgi:hypothetical protein